MTSSERHRRLVDTIGLLQVPGIGGGRFDRLVRAFGSAGAASAASIAELAAVPGISRALATAIHEQYDEASAEATAGQIAQLGWAVIFPDDADYPPMLSALEPPPPLLFRVGEPAHASDRMIAIVGTRHPTERGRMFAHGLARALAESGIAVVSGMAEGIDTAAHTGALDGGGRTVAVWGSSLDQVYPPTNRGLADRIRERGAIYSEYLPGTFPDRPHFPERNRIISGMAWGVVVVEAGDRSGALITAEHALRQNRTVFAVPGPPGATASLGCNELLKQGAGLVTSVEDIFRELPTLRGEVKVQRAAERPDLTPTEREIVALFTAGPVQLDDLARRLNKPVAELTQFLLALELKGVVLELAGKRFTLSDEFA
ncbi:MAG TPA: DNA-processing protein DprA [candidate division Zixibacteria bacterium]|nr:DNA-processing protein DprA [candidate division Zixibacteria bacterium]MDD4917396.1 DNA-processing protein DprA [candidate division Zixibacteria bacterium]MDM7972394.1 DNA-processing protein DprA [candidate division Zixibacteria bacterium]HOD66198.1 DNA-processing protein DprA [candidate division Zixibacteria bacterium]